MAYNRAKLRANSRIISLRAQQMEAARRLTPSIARLFEPGRSLPDKGNPRVIGARKVTDLELIETAGPPKEEEGQSSQAGAEQGSF